MKKCKTCNSEFSPKDKRKQYCSEKCKWRFENNKSLKKTLEKRKNIVVNDLADEYWKDVVGYEGIYKVSNLSRLKTVSREKKVLRNAKEVNIQVVEKLLTGQINSCGYKVFGLTKNNKYKVNSLHRIVALAFIPNPNNYDTVNHKDGNKLNNSIDNLEWCTQRENVIHAWRTGLSKPYQRIKGIKGVRGKLKKPIYDSPDKYHMAKKVICLKTGKIYGSVKSASVDINIRKETLARMLRGDRRNTTTLKYYTVTL